MLGEETRDISAEGRRIKFDCTTEDATQTDLEGEQLNNGRVEALVKCKSPVRVQNPGYRGN